MIAQKIYDMKKALFLLIILGFAANTGFSGEQTNEHCDVVCAEDEFINSECECTPLGGGLVYPCFGIIFALLAVAGFAIRKG